MEINTMEREMTEAPTQFYMRRIGSMALFGSIVTNLVILTAMYSVIAAFAPVTPSESIAMVISN